MQELAVARISDRVGVDAIAPGLIESATTTAMRGMPELEKAEFAACPMGRRVAPEDLAPAPLFLASSAAS